MILKSDCRHFPGDRPCIFNKRDGIMCDDCPHYSPVKNKILIIKLDAIGDVLRTTSILPSLKKAYPDSHITWLTKSNAKEIFANNPLVDELMIYNDPSTTARLMSEKYNLMIHTDASPKSAALASIVNAEIKKGFMIDEKGKVTIINDEAIEWFEMGAFDQLKKANVKSYQQIIHEIIGLPYDASEIQLFLDDDEQRFKNDFYNKHDLKRFDFLIGLNTGAGSRWQFKQWRLKGYIELIEIIKSKYNAGILLYGGPEEKDRNAELKNHFPDLIDTGTSNSLRHFFALLDLSDIVVTGDTMALHAAAALKKQVVCVFGPTSFNEIEDYGRIDKVYPKMECLVCYKPTCDFVPNCMELITTSMVFGAVEKSIAEIK